MLLVKTLCGKVHSSMKCTENSKEKLDLFYFVYDQKLWHK